MPRISKAKQARRENCQKARSRLPEFLEQISEDRRLPGQKLRITKIMQFFEGGPRPFCSHIFVSSSKFAQLIQGTLGARDVHGKKKDRDDYEIGQKWERHVFDLGEIPDSKTGPIQFRLLEQDPLFYSQECRFLVAQPDMRAQIVNENGDFEQVLIEIKSTNRPENYKSFKTGRASSQKYQLQVALNCSGIQRGFLIFARGSALTPQESENIGYRVFEIERNPNFIQINQGKISRGYAYFLADLAAYPHRPSKMLIEFAASELQRANELLFPRKDKKLNCHKSLPPSPHPNFRQQCQINRMIIKDQLAALQMKRSVGRPTKKASELKRPKYGKRMNLKGQIRFPDQN